MPLGDEDCLMHLREVLIVQWETKTLVLGHQCFSVKGRCMRRYEVVGFAKHLQEREKKLEFAAQSDFLVHAWGLSEKVR